MLAKEESRHLQCQDAYSTITSFPGHNQCGKLNIQKHLGHWKKKQYCLGRYCSGGFWSCCGQNDQMAFACDAETREHWEQTQAEVDVLVVERVVRRAMAAIARSKWRKDLDFDAHKRSRFFKKVIRGSEIQPMATRDLSDDVCRGVKFDLLFVRQK